jgi:hypothetical protein
MGAATAQQSFWTTGTNASLERGKAQEHFAVQILTHILRTLDRLSLGPAFGVHVL